MSQVPWNKGKKNVYSEETLEKMRKPKSEEHKKKLSIARMGKIPWNKGISLSEETKQKMRDNHADVSKEKNPMWGKRPSNETIRKNSLSQIGKKCGILNPMFGKKRPDLSERNKNNILSGESNPNWNGGTSFEPYCYKFNKKLKEEIRKRDNYQCQYPGCLCTQLESLVLYSQSLHVHHVHYKKEDCNPDLIALCNKHNSIANFNRNYWEELFMNILKRRILC